MEQVIEQYQVIADEVRINVNITGTRGMLKKYVLDIPKSTPATKALMDNIRAELISAVAVSTAEILDPKTLHLLKEKFKKKANLIMQTKVPNIPEQTKAYLIGMLLHEMVGLGEIEFLLTDPNIEEIVINTASEPVRVYHKKYGWLETNVYVKNEGETQNYSNVIARRVGRQITTLNPLLDAHLVTGDRANAVLYPIANKGNTITIRKFSRDPWTIVDFIMNKTCSYDIFALLWIMIQYEMNIIISGGTGSGKTSMLNVCMPFIPPNQRVITIEDTRELQLPKFMYWCPLTTRQANPEGKGEVSMLDLLINSLRMRPDRIILGEIRRREEAQVLFEAMHTGHSVYATVHADSIAETISRLSNPPISVPKNLLPVVDLNIVMFRDRRKGIRRTFQVGEFIPSQEGSHMDVKPNVIFRQKPGTDELVKHSSPVNIYENISKHTGLSHQDIEKDMQIKKAILAYMVKHNISNIESVGKILNQYYIDPDMVINVVQNNLGPEKLLEND